MDDNRAETCGRCSMTSVVSMTNEEEASTHDPFDGDRIEVSESEIETVSKHQVVLGRVKRRLNEIATQLTYGR